MHVEVKLSEIEPSPFRRPDKYPLDEARVRRLQSSISRTDFWGNVVVRRRGSQYQLAYGHHRIEAARRERGPEARVQVILKDLSDEELLKIQAADNDELYALKNRFILETVEGAVSVLGKKISCRAPGTRAVASVRKGEGRLAKDIAKFLDWPVSRVESAVAQLASIAGGTVSREAIETLPNAEAADHFHRALKKAELEGKRIPLPKQVEIASAVKRHTELRPRAAVRSYVSEYLHPVDPDLAGEKDQLLELIKQAASRAHVLDTALTELRKHRNKLHSQQYRHRLEVIDLAAHCHDIMKQIPALFGPKGPEQPGAASRSSEHAECLQ